MIEIVLIVVVVMFGTLLIDQNKRPKFILKEGFNQPYYNIEIQRCSVPKTLVPPIIAPPIADIYHWGNNTNTSSSKSIPSYITRNKVDIYSFGDNLHQPVDIYHDLTLQHRSDIIQSIQNRRKTWLPDI